MLEIYSGRPSALNIWDPTLLFSCTLLPFSISLAFFFAYSALFHYSYTEFLNYSFSPINSLNEFYPELFIFLLNFALDKVPRGVFVIWLSGVVITIFLMSWLESAKYLSALFFNLRLDRDLIASRSKATP